MMPESVCFDEFFIIKKSGMSVPLLYIKLKLVGEANVPSHVFLLTRGFRVVGWITLIILKR